MSRDNVLPFRQRPPSTEEMEAYRQITRNWHPEMRRLVLPDYANHDRQPASED